MSKVKDKSKILAYVLNGLVLQRIHIAMLYIKFFKEVNKKRKIINVKLG